MTGTREYIVIYAGGDPQLTIYFRGTHSCATGTPGYPSTGYVEQRDNRSRAALSDKCRSTCGSGYGSELTRRGGGDHGQRLKRVWGAKH